MVVIMEEQHHLEQYYQQMVVIIILEVALLIMEVITLMQLNLVAEQHTVVFLEQQVYGEEEVEGVLGLAIVIEEMVYDPISEVSGKHLAHLRIVDDETG